MQNDMLERQINFLSDQMYDTVGLPRTGPRYPERKVIHMSGVTLNNIRVDKSTIGVLNTGTIQSVDTAVTTLQQSGEERLSQAILQLAQAVLANTEVQNERKNDIIEILSILSAEATAPKERRRSKAMRPLLQQLAKLVSMAMGLAELWKRVRPILESAFQ